jgi:hypothetical protein
MRDARQSLMALREFNDDLGREWRAWDVRREHIHPATRAEDYMRDYIDGWLAFEAVDGEAKCRLSPIPVKWELAEREQLVMWLHRAEPVRGDRTSGPHGTVAAQAGTGVPSAAERPRGAARTFRFPTGRFWSAAEWTTSSDVTGESHEHTVLRFTSGRRSLDLRIWPDDWRTMSDEQLATLLARGFPRPAQPNATSFRRRASDEELR